MFWCETEYSVAAFEACGALAKAERTDAFGLFWALVVASEPRF